MEAEETGRSATTKNCFDYLKVICAWIKSSPLTFHFRHIKGHETTKITYDQLDWWGQRNENVDKAAK